MAVKAGELIKRLLVKAGVDITAPELKAILESEIEVPDDAANKVEKGLLTVEAAKSNSEVNKALRASILGVADEKINELIIELGLTPDATFAEEKNTYERLVKIVKLAKEEGKKATKAGDKDEANAWIEKEKTLQAQLRDLNQKLTTQETTFNTTRETDLTEFEIQKILLTKTFSLPKEMDPALKVQTAMSVLRNELAKNGHSLKRDTTTGKLSIVDKDGQPAYNEKHEALEPNTFIDGALAQNKLLEINKVENQQQQQSQQEIEAAKGAGGNKAIVDEIQAQIASLPG